MDEFWVWSCQKETLCVPKITLWKSGRLCLVSQRKRRIWVGWSGQGILLSLSDSHYIAHVDDGVRYCFIKSKTWMMLLLLPSYSPQSAPIWPFIEVVEDKGRRSGLRERVGTKTWVAMLCFYRSALRALSLSLSAPADPTLPRVMGLPVQATVEQPLSSASTIALHCIQLFAMHSPICTAVIYIFEANIVIFIKIFLSKLPPSNHPLLHQPLHYNASNYLQYCQSSKLRKSKLLRNKHPSPSILYLYWIWHNQFLKTLKAVCYW